MSSTSPVQESPQKSQFTSDQRWQDVALDFRLMQTREEAEEGKNSPRARWKRAVFLASRLQDGTRDPTGQTQMSPPDEETPPASSERKQLELQHWLELIDGKHRYGSNLKYYHRRWQEDDSTKQNFFYWLDRGEGRELSLEDCPRDKLENQRISYLSAEQRLNYLVTIDNDGKLRWKRNDQLLDTTPGKWKDTKDHSGIIPKDHPLHNKGQSFAKGKSREGPGVHRFLRTWTTLYNRLIKKEVWIYVADKNNNVYIGIKDTGTFQHSSFLAGGLVTSAGIISVKKGVIHTLRPLSGHYRTTQKHFHGFIIALKEKGADLEKADILEGKLALWGTQKLGKAQKAPKQAKELIKSEIQDSSTKIAEKVSKVEDSSWKRDVLYGRKNPQSKENGHTIS